MILHAHEGNYRTTLQGLCSDEKIYHRWRCCLENKDLYINNVAKRKNLREQGRVFLLPPFHPFYSFSSSAPSYPFPTPPLSLLSLPSCPPLLLTCSLATGRLGSNLLTSCSVEHCPISEGIGDRSKKSVNIIGYDCCRGTCTPFPRALPATGNLFHSLPVSQSVSRGCPCPVSIYDEPMGSSLCGCHKMSHRLFWAFNPYLGLNWRRYEQYEEETQMTI